MANEDSKARKEILKEPTLRAISQGELEKQFKQKKRLYEIKSLDIEKACDKVRDGK